MAKDLTEKKLKKDKKEKKEKRSETDGVTKSSKKEKKVQVDAEMVDALEAELEKAPEVQLVRAGEEDGEEPKGALVPFAFPLADNEKEVKKILKTVKKSAKSKTLRRGVKEVVKALRKSAASGPSSSDLTNPSAIVVIAADISPMDVISHIPVLCEDHNVPYIYIKSRAQLGEASATKRPTSVVMIAKDRTGKKGGKEEDDAEFKESYVELAKVVGKASKSVRK
ncbi:L30e-like protein [Plenodomus tracheiphilus IPT5]|uniref:L30e-like protein n=1 Tax=Plenodomus tracheiphilus IPT5 TaxID=1408161 RepID=A0A6A7AYF4_9PLEO|nr:L30e-like protein [Plenodomus tracheiphilus IPT5]